MRLQTDPRPEKTLDQLAAEINAAAMAKPDSVADLTDDQLRKLAREKLSQALQAIDPTNQPEMTRKLCAELMDRLDGKPAQMQTLDIHTKTEIVSISLTDQQILKKYLEQPK